MAPVTRLNLNGPVSVESGTEVYEPANQGAGSGAAQSCMAVEENGPKFIICRSAVGWGSIFVVALQLYQKTGVHYASSVSWGCNHLHLRLLRRCLVSAFSCLAYCLFSLTLAAGRYLARQDCSFLGINNTKRLINYL